MNRTAAFYIVTLTFVGIGILTLLHLGASLPSPQGPVPMVPSMAAATANVSATASVMAGLSDNLKEPLSHLFVQLLVIIVAARLMGA